MHKLLHLPTITRNLTRVAWRRLHTAWQHRHYTWCQIRHRGKHKPTVSEGRPGIYCLRCGLFHEGTGVVQDQRQ